MQGNYFFTRYTYNPRRKKVWQVICKFLQKYIPADSSIIDVGAGYCDFINNIKGKEKYAIDSFADFRDYANPEVKTYVGKCTDMSCFPSDHFDIIFSSNLLEHLSIEEILKSLDEFFRILKPDGKLS